MLCLFRVLLGMTATVTSFPLSKNTGGGGTTPIFSGLCVYLQFTWVFPPLLSVFLPPPLLQAFPLLVAGWVLSLLPSPAGLFIYSSLRNFPSPPFGTQGTPPSLLRVCFVVVYYSVWLFFPLFSLGGGQSVQGAMLILPRVVCRSTTCQLAHLVVYIFPSSMGAGIW
jgi:hypothetical protein